MLPLALPLSLLCLALGPYFTVALPTLLPASQLPERSFNVRQKWERNEVNCIQILNPAPGAAYYPGYFVRMIYGTANCEGFTATGPLAIHLYNNPEMRGGRIRYDYHEVIADGLGEDENQFLWNIPSNDEAKFDSVQKTADYYVRIETNSDDGVKLVGNAGPFAIYPNTETSGLRRRSSEDPAAAFASSDGSTQPAADLGAEYALRPVRGPNAVPEPMTDAPIIMAPPSAPEAITVLPETPSPVESTAPPPQVNASSETVETLKPKDGGDTLNPSLSTKLPDLKNTDGIISQEPVPLDKGVAPGGEVSTSKDQAPQGSQDEVMRKPPITEISHRSLIPSKFIVATAVGAGAVGLGIVGGNLFGQFGAAVGAVIGGIIGGLAVVLSFVGVPV
ncbi:hypothetical protein BGZ70_008635 [Mortierella alpina]|uniref:Uncharacterized protein n=1 Tax=Mortierella alpina TaxID=64518 RepID=A0A9P6M0M0_MORAP|nr:hypothetical protein BGZ70_008635 [Mortierella alpina]